MPVHDPYGIEAPGVEEELDRLFLKNHVFKVKVEEVRTTNQTGKLRRRGKFSGYRPDWKKAYVRLKEGQKVPEYAEI